MRVLHLDLGQNLRGGQRQVYYLVRAMVQASSAEQPAWALPSAAAENVPITTVACPGESPLAHLLRAEGLPVSPLPGRSLVNPQVLWSLLRLVHTFHPTVLHTHDAQAATLGALCKRLQPHLKLVHSRRVSYAPKTGLRLHKYLIADAVVGVSQEISSLMVQAGVPKSHVHTIHSGIDPTRYAPHQSHAGPFTFGAVGALSPQKGYGVLLEAMALLQASPSALPLWQVRLVGNGALLESLQNQARSLGIAHRLHMPGRLDSLEVLPFFDAMVVPSVDGEGSSATIKEGWASGIPVLCSSLVSNLELVTPDVDGLTAPPGNAKALARIMERCLTDALLRERLAAAGKCTLQAFTDRRMATSYMELYVRL